MPALPFVLHSTSPAIYCVHTLHRLPLSCVVNVPSEPSGQVTHSGPLNHCPTNSGQNLAVPAVICARRPEDVYRVARTKLH